MSKTVAAEFFALYRFKKAMELCARDARSIQSKAEELSLPQSAFTKVPSSKKIHQAWQTVCEDRAKEAKALHDELEAVGRLMEAVAELYGWTDAELANAVARAEKLR